jgi:hypothetical protein
MGSKVKYLQRLMFFFLVLLLSGCSIPFFGGYGSKGRSRDEFAQYVEEVFKLQNHITSQIMILMESGNPKLQQPIINAEQHMQDICSPINEYASRDIDGLYISFSLRRRVEKSAEDCDKAAHEVKDLLKAF